MKKLEYSVVVPSKGRPENMEKTLYYFPEAIVMVDEAERDDYAGFVPEKQLRTHPSLVGLSRIRNHILRTRESDTVVMVDDDIKEIRAMVGKKPRKIKDPESVRRILENAITILRDSGRHLYLFNRGGTPWSIQLHRPITCGSGTPSGIMVFNGERDYRFDETLFSHEDNDYVLQVLLGNQDRFVFVDNRFFFEFDYKNNKGGLQSIRTRERVAADENHLVEKWGPWVSMETSSQGNLFPKIKVRRKDN